MNRILSVVLFSIAGASVVGGATTPGGTADDLTFVNQEGDPVLEPGNFDVIVGGLTRTFQVRDSAVSPSASE